MLFCLSKLLSKMTAPRAFPGGPLIKTLSSNAARLGLIPVEELGSHMPHSQKKNKNHKTNIIVTN